MNRNEKLETEVAKLGDLPREELVARWIKTYGCPPPKGLKRGLLERAAAWQLQAKTLGSFSTETKKLLKAATRQLDVSLKQRTGDPGQANGIATTAAGIAPSVVTAHNRDSHPDDPIEPPPTRVPLCPGTRLLREWNGRQHFVEVVDKGFVFDGKTYRSLSAIARRITGAHWSGPRFFGL